ncbi:Vam6/Vps39-like protein [Rhizoclosmatium sp. JEL0117]|nr:Vam6/Vps39-like protein [Rhizoclosmatium sp. JEL0117]
MFIPLKTHLKIVRFFEDKSPQLEVQYLEFLIEELRSEQPEFHERLVLLYLQELVDAMAEMESSPPKTGGRLFGQDMDEGTDTRFLYTRRKLVSFLERSKAYRPDRIVSLFPDEVLLEERTIVLGRLRRHTEAIKICVEKLENYKLAER